MRLKHYIAFALLAVYLFAVGAPAYAAMTCSCTAAKTQTEHRCCAHCNHDDSVTKGRVHFESPCCDDRHSTDVELYTSSSQDGERHAKRIASLTLPPAILTEPVVMVDHTCEFCGYIAVEHISSVPDAHVSSCGLRAPPVLV